jgi:hypothetical protein
MRFDMYWRRRDRLREEIGHHLAEETAENISRGMQPEKARQAALQAFGHVEVTKERMRELDPLYWLDTLLQDVRFAFQIIRRNGWLSAIVVSTLVLGIGLNVSVFTVLNALLLRPWVRTQAETFVSLFPNFGGSYQLKFSDYASMSQPDYLWYRDSAKSIKSLAAYRLIDATLGGTEAGSVHAALISCNMQDVLGSGSPLAGRFLAADECGNTGSGGVALLGETAWRTRFNSDHGIVGRTIHLNRLPLTIVGVAPAFSLSSPDREPDVWLPYTMLTALRPEDDYFADPRAQWLTVIGRRDSHYSIRQVQEESDTPRGAGGLMSWAVSKTAGPWV